MKKLRIGLLLSVMFAAVSAEAQKYHSIQPFAAGIRGCYDGAGANFRYFFFDLLSIEGQVNASGGKPGGEPYSSGKSLVGVGLLQLNFMLYNPNLRMFVGAGFHTGNWQRYKNVGKPEHTFGYDGIIGVEYAFSSLPLTFSLDFKPAMSYNGGTTYFPNNIVGLSGRYYFGHWKKPLENEKG